MLRGEASRAELVHQSVVDHGAQGRVLDRIDFHHLMRGAEAVKEVHEWHACAKRRGVRDHGEVLGLLHGRRGKHRPPDLTRSHDVGVVTKNRKRVRGNCAGGDVEDHRGQLARDLEHVGQHEQEALRRGKSRRHHACLQ